MNMAGITLFDYQEEAVKKMKTGSILCGDVGSGKSRTALAYYYLLNGGEVGTEAYVPMSDPPQDLYIITTARKRDTLEWEKELIPFLLSTHPDQNIYHHSITVDSWNNISKYTDVENSFFIFDEQRVIGRGQWVKSFLKIAKSNDWILLSATPGDTWQDYIPVFIANGFYKNRSEFNREHIVWKSFTRFPQIDRYLHTGKLNKLRNDILVTMDYRKETIQHHEDVYLNYDAAKYRSISKLRQNPYNDNLPIENASEYCYTLRRVLNEDTSRQLYLLELLETHERAIVFYSFDYELEILKNLALPPGFKRAEWNGHKHEPIPIGDKWIYLVQYTAGAEGWNCVTTDTIIFYSQQYSYKILKQSSGRIDRLNTPYKDLYYYHFKSRAGIDIAISRALDNKKDFNIRMFYEKGK